MSQNVYAAVFGTKISYADPGDTPSYTPLSGVKEIGTLPTLETDEFETTRIDQADPVKQFAPSMADPGELGVTLGHDPTIITTVYGLHRVTKLWKIEFSDGSTLTFSGWIKTIGHGGDAPDEATLPITIRVTGKAVFAAAT